MAKGENIYKRKDGRWEARYARDYDITGRIRYGYCYGKTYKEAKEKVTKAKAALLIGKPVSTTRVTNRFAFFCDTWLQSRKGKAKESTCVKYAAILEKHIKPSLGGCYPLAITESLINTFSDKLLFERELSPKTVKDILVILRSILNFTAKNVPGTFPRIDIVYPKEEKKEMRVLTRDEQTVFINYLLTNMDECRFGVLLALLTGIRIGELCALRWGNISLKDKTIKIACTMQRLKNVDSETAAKTKIVIGSPKTENSTRIIPMSDDAAALCRKMYPKSAAAFVLTGTPDYMEPRALQYRMERYTKACGLQGVHFHTLRHTFATRCVEVGFELKSLSEILRHANTTITLDRYVHSSMELKRDNMNKLAMIGM